MVKDLQSEKRFAEPNGIDEKAKNPLDVELYDIGIQTDTTA